MEKSLRKLSSLALSFCCYLIFTFAITFILALLWAWVKAPSGSSLSSKDAWNAVDFAVVFAIAFTLGDRLRRPPATKE